MHRHKRRQITRCFQTDVHTDTETQLLLICLLLDVLQRLPANCWFSRTRVDAP